MENNNNILLEVNNLKTYFFYDEGTVKVIDGIDFKILKGKTLGVVGELGCGNPSPKVSSHTY